MKRIQITRLILGGKVIELILRKLSWAGALAIFFITKYPQFEVSRCFDEETKTIQKPIYVILAEKSTFFNSYQFFGL